MTFDLCRVGERAVLEVGQELHCEEMVAGEGPAASL